MWISRKLAEESDYEKAESGLVSMNSSKGLEAGASLNERGVKCYSPYGYSANVPPGEEVVLIPFQSGRAAVGTREKENSLSPGEVEISSSGGASIVLKNDGRVIINGRFVIDKDGSAEYVQN